MTEDLYAIPPASLATSDPVLLGDSIYIREIRIGVEARLLDIRTSPETWPWGTYGKQREHDLKWITLGEASTEHLENILKTEAWHLMDEYIGGILAILKKRYRHIGMSASGINVAGCTGQMDPVASPYAVPRLEAWSKFLSVSLLTNSEEAYKLVKRSGISGR